MKEFVRDRETGVISILKNRVEVKKSTSRWARFRWNLQQALR